MKTSKEPEPNNWIVVPAYDGKWKISCKIDDGHCVGSEELLQLFNTKSSAEEHCDKINKGLVRTGKRRYGFSVKRPPRPTCMPISVEGVRLEDVETPSGIASLRRNGEKLRKYLLKR